MLFVQNESMYQLQARAGWSESSAEKASGFLGGASIALFVNPMQKVKVSGCRDISISVIRSRDGISHTCRRLFS